MDPVLSIIVVIVSDTTESRADVAHLASCLASLANQVGAPPIETIVPYHEDVDGIDRLRREFPWVTFLPVADVQIARGKGGGREHHDTLRARGLAVARGRLVGLLEDHARADATWCANVVAAHQQDYAAIGGAIENGIDRALNWAVYFCDFWRYQNPLPAGESAIASDANVTYKRAALERVRASWEHSFREIVVNGALMGLGEQVALSPEIIVYQERRDLRLGAAVHERYIWGRSYAATRSRQLSTPRRAVLAVLSPLLPVILLLRMAGTARARRRSFGKFVRALPLIALLVTVWSVGEAVGYVGGISPHRPEAPE